MATRWCTLLQSVWAPKRAGKYLVSRDARSVSQSTMDLIFPLSQANTTDRAFRASPSSNFDTIPALFDLPHFKGEPESFLQSAIARDLRLPEGFDNMVRQNRPSTMQSPSRRADATRENILTARISIGYSLSKNWTSKPNPT